MIHAGMAAIGAALATTAAAPAALLNVIASVGSRRSAQGFAYGPHERHRFDLYTPGEPVVNTPLVVFLHGGAWNRGRREDYRFVGEALAARGVIAMVADYRLHPEVRYPAFVADSALAVAHALRNALSWGADPDRVFVAGHSAGAYNAAMVALDERWLGAVGAQRERLAGWIGLAGPYDFLPIRTPEVQSAFGHPEVPVDSQPIHHASASVLPCLLAAGRTDERVDPERNTAGLARLLRSRGTRVVEHRYPRAGHETLVAAFAWPLRPLAPVLDDIVSFSAAARATSRHGAPRLRPRGMP